MGVVAQLPLCHQISFEEFQKITEERRRQDMEILKRTRVARAENVLDFISWVNKANKKQGALMQCGDARFDFDKIYHEQMIAAWEKLSLKGRLTVPPDEVRRVVRQQLQDKVVQLLQDAENAADRACGACEYVSRCQKRGHLYEDYAAPKMYQNRAALARRMQIVVAAEGAQNMDCQKAMAIKRPVKTDWDCL